jgi:hypothetical protein
MDILEITEKSEDFQKPDDNNNYNHYVENVFDFTIHRDVVIDKVQKYSGNNQYEQYSKQ